MNYHRCRDGTVIPYDKITDSHLDNIIKFIEKRAVEGIRIPYADSYCDPDSYDVDYLTGPAALAFLKYNSYIEERQRRKDEHSVLDT